jgi:cytidylate kinase
LSKATTIAIDGPAASGKSTIGYLLAKSLGYLYLDTGAMYRAVALAALKRGIDIDDEEAVSSLARSIDLEILPAKHDDGRQYTVLLDGEDVTWQIRSPEVNSVVSHVSAYPVVRRAMTELQREIGKRGKVVMVGRDIGTVVMPDADLKIYLDASVEERARRRYRDLLERKSDVSLEEVIEQIKKRDTIDSGRALAPLRPAKDAFIIDTTDMCIDDVLNKALELAEDP